MAKGKLHEVLAVEKGLEATQKKVIDEADAVFRTKPDRFLGFVKSYEPFEENEAHLAGVAEQHEVTTTVRAKLEWIFRHIGQYLDAVAQKDKTNMVAKSDVVIDGVTILKDMPVTFLLGFETKIKQWRAALANIPTLKPGISWVPDETKGAGIYRQEHPEVRFRTKKSVRHKVLYEATDNHPAQIEKWTEDEKVGKIITEVWSGMISPAEKAALLTRLDKLERAVKKARMRGNYEEVVDARVGKVVTEYLLDGTLSDK